MDNKEFLMNAHQFSFLLRPKSIHQKLRPSEALVFMTIWDLHKKKLDILPSTISHHCDLSRSAVTQILNQLHVKELIERSVDQKDRRRVLILPLKKNMERCLVHDTEMIEVLRTQLGEPSFLQLSALLEQSNHLLKKLENLEESQ